VRVLFATAELTPLAAVGGLWLAAFGWLVAGRAPWAARAVEGAGDG